MQKWLLLFLTRSVNFFRFPKQWFSSDLTQVKSVRIGKFFFAFFPTIAILLFQCPERLGTLEALCNHLHQIHNAPTQIQTRICQNESEFQVTFWFLSNLLKRSNWRPFCWNWKARAATFECLEATRIWSRESCSTSDVIVCSPPRRARPRGCMTRLR